MLVKINHPEGKPIRIGKETYRTPEVVAIPDKLLYTPRIQRMRKKKWLIFPFNQSESKE